MANQNVLNALQGIFVNKRAQLYQVTALRVIIAKSEKQNKSVNEGHTVIIQI